MIKPYILDCFQDCYPHKYAMVQRYTLWWNLGTSVMLTGSQVVFGSHIRHSHAGDTAGPELSEDSQTRCRHWPVKSPPPTSELAATFPSLPLTLSHQVSILGLLLLRNKLHLNFPEGQLDPLTPPVCLPRI